MSSSPLRSATDRSDPGFVRAAEAERVLIATSAGDDGTVHPLPAAAGVLIRARYPAYEGPVSNGPHLRIGLCLGAGSRLTQDIGTARIEGVWRLGTLTITPPHCNGFAACRPVAMLGLAIIPDSFTTVPPLDADLLQAFAMGFHSDPLIVSVLTALHHEADAHGSATAFFEHGIALILRRLHEPQGSSPAGRSVKPLSQTRYARLLAYVEARLGNDLPVTDMAAVAGMDPSGFTRALRADRPCALRLADPAADGPCRWTAGRWNVGHQSGRQGRIRQRRQVRRCIPPAARSAAITLAMRL